MNGHLEPENYKYIWIITRPTGCGKTTVAKYLAEKLSLSYIEGDDVWPNFYKQFLLWLYAYRIF
jgi:gluconokinase